MFDPEKVAWFWESDLGAEDRKFVDKSDYDHLLGLYLALLADVGRIHDPQTP